MFGGNGGDYLLSLIYQGLHAPHFIKFMGEIPPFLGEIH